MLIIAELARKAGAMNAKFLVTLVILVTAIVYAWPQKSIAAPPAMGTSIVLQNSAPGVPKASRCANPYIARYGDTVLTIAARCGVSASTIMQLNGLRTYRVSPGQRLYIARVTKSPAPQAVPTPWIEPRIRP